MKYSYLILFVLLFSQCQDRSETKMDNPNNLPNQIEKWISISKDSTGLTQAERNEYLKRAENKTNTIANDTLRLDYLSKISLAYKRIKDSLGFRAMNQKVITLSEENGIYKTLGESHWDLASFFKEYNVLDSAFYHYRSAHRSFDKLPVDSTSISLKGRMLYSMGQIQDSFSDYLGGEINTTQALKIFDDLEDQYRIYNCYNLLAILSNGLGNAEKSLEYYQKARDILNKLQKEDMKLLIWQNQNNAANVYLRMEDYAEAQKNYNELVKNNSVLKDDPELYAIALSGYGYSLYKEKEYRVSKAEEYLKEAIKIQDSLGDVYNKSRTKQYYAEVKMAQGDTAQAIQLAKESRTIAQETSNNDRSLEVLRLLTLWDTKNAVAYSTAYYDLNETIQEEERAKRDKFARIRLETDEVIEENKFLTRQRQLWIAGGLIFLFVGATTIIIATQYISNSRLKFKQKQQEANQQIYNLLLSQEGKVKAAKQEEQKRISEDLHDAVLGEMLGIRLILGSLNGKSDEEATKKRNLYLKRLQDVEEHIRTISHELSDASYEKFSNFIVSLQDMVAGFSEGSHMACHLTYNPKVKWDILFGDVKINVYRIIQESLKNSLKHAQCDEVEINLNIKDDILELKIADNGIGFEAKRTKSGIGMRNINSRVDKLKGVLEITSEKGKGTTILVQIPKISNFMEYPEKKRSEKVS